MKCLILNYQFLHDLLPASLFSITWNQFLHCYTLITLNYFHIPKLSFPGASVVQNLPANSGDTGDWHRFDPWVWNIPLRRKLQPPPVFLPGESLWTEKPDGLQSMGSQRVGYDWACSHMNHGLPCLCFCVCCSLLATSTVLSPSCSFLLFCSSLTFGIDSSEKHIKSWIESRCFSSESTASSYQSFYNTSYLCRIENPCSHGFSNLLKSETLIFWPMNLQLLGQPWLRIDAQ